MINIDLRDPHKYNVHVRTVSILPSKYIIKLLVESNKLETKLSQINMQVFD